MINQHEAGLLRGGMCERLKQAVLKYPRDRRFLVQSMLYPASLSLFWRLLDTLGPHQGTNERRGKGQADSLKSRPIRPAW